jgi:hypothetical protein
MGIVLVVIGVLCGAGGTLGFLGSTTGLGQILSAVFFLAGAVLLSGGLLIVEIQRLHTTVALAATAANKAREA